MTIEEHKEKLKELHESIKNNPFRRGYVENARYGEGYYDIVYKFAETFYHLIKDIQKNETEITEPEDKKLAKVSVALFIHDFYAAVNRSHNAIYSYNHGKEDRISILHEEEELIELCISCIHGYLDTGLFNRYPFRYHGGVKWIEWNDDKNDYIIDLSK